jgi:hypothetical protein
VRIAMLCVFASLHLGVFALNSLPTSEEWNAMSQRSRDAK